MPYQWESSPGTTFGTIAGATGSTYTLASVDTGMYIRVHETSGGVETYSAARGPVVSQGDPFFDFRGFYDINRLSITDGWYSASNFNAIEAYQNNSGSTALFVRALDSIATNAPGSDGWMWAGGFRNAAGASTSSTGYTASRGIMRIEDASTGGGGYAGKIIDVLTCTDQGTRTMACLHPANSHRYDVLDDTQIGSKTSLGTTWALALSTVGTFVRNIHSVYATYNPSVTPICGVTAFRTTEMADWVGIADELWLDIYPNILSPGYNSTIVPAAAAACDSAGIPYVGITSAHDYSNLKYPTPGTYTKQMDEWRATNARGILCYLWPDDGVGAGLYLAGDTTSGLREQIAIENLKTS